MAVQGLEESESAGESSPASRPNWKSEANHSSKPLTPFETETGERRLLSTVPTAAAEGILLTVDWNRKKFK